MDTRSKKVRIVPYILKGQIQSGDWSYAFEQLHLDSLNDRLADNYSGTKLNLDKMYNFTFTYDGDNIVQCSGTQICNDKVVRVLSRYYVFNEYRTDGTNPLEKTDDFAELKYTLNTLSDFPLVIWTRDKGKGFFKRLKRGRPDIFSEWKVYPEQIELMHKDNYQSVFYTGDITHLHSLQYESLNQMKH
jgi:hypothetical protein